MHLSVKAGHAKVAETYADANIEKQILSAKNKMLATESYVDAHPEEDLTILKNKILFDAIWYRDERLVRKCLYTWRINPNCRGGPDEEPALHYLFLSGMDSKRRTGINWVSESWAKLLVEAGVDPKEKDKDDDNGLFAAAYYSAPLECIAYLLKHDPSLYDETDRKGMVLLQRMSIISTPVLRLLLTDERHQNYINKTDTLLIKEIREIMWYDELSIERAKERIQILLEAGANPTIEGSYYGSNYTPSALVRSRCSKTAVYKEAIEELIDILEKAEKEFRSGKTPKRGSTGSTISDGSSVSVASAIVSTSFAPEVSCGCGWSVKKAEKKESPTTFMAVAGITTETNTYAKSNKS